MVELLKQRPIEQTKFMDSHESFKKNCRKQFSLNCFGDTTKYLDDLEVRIFSWSYRKNSLFYHSLIFMGII